MNELELLEFLENNILFFDGVTKEDFSLLKKLQPDELGLMNPDVYRVTPLLKQISNYAIVAAGLEEHEKNDIQSIVGDETYKTVVELCNRCLEYSNILLENECHHSSILNAKNAANACFLYAEINQYICELIEETDGTFQDDLIDFGNEFDEKIIDGIEKLYEQLLVNIEINSPILPKQLLYYLFNYIHNEVRIIALLYDESSSYYDNYIVNILTQKSFSEGDTLYLAKTINGLSSIMKKVNLYQEDCFDVEILELLNKLIEGYTLYEGYRCNYFQNAYRERKILEKCKKM